MATNDKPQAFPTWTSGEATQVAAPSPSQQASGFTEGQRPTYQLLNWLFWVNGQWAEHLDSQSTNNTQYIVTNPLVRLIGGGLWSFDGRTHKLAWSEDAYIAVPGISDAGNTIPAGSATLPPGQVAYVQVDPKASSSQQLQVFVSDSTTLSFDQNTIIVARCTSLATYASQVMVGVNAGQMVVRHGEQKELLGSGYATFARIKAGQPLTASQAVYVSTGATGGRTVGSVYAADAGAASGATRAKACGFVVADCSAGDDALVATSGTVNNLTGLVPGGLVYLDPATPGAITQTIPTATGAYVVPVGIALTATSLRVNPAAAEMAYNLQSGLVVNGMLAVNGLSAFKPGVTGKTITLYDAAGQTVVAAVDDTGAATFASSVTTGQGVFSGAVALKGNVAITGAISNPVTGINQFVGNVSASTSLSAPTVSSSGNLVVGNGNGAVAGPNIFCDGYVQAGSLRSTAGIKNTIFMGGYSTPNYQGGIQPLMFSVAGTDVSRNVSMAFAGSILAVAATFSPALPNGTAVGMTIYVNGVSRVMNLSLNAGRTSGTATVAKGSYPFNARDRVEIAVVFSPGGFGVTLQADLSIESDA